MSSVETARFGKYELLDRIAVGGMAEIFRARYQPAPGVTKQVVIKRILPHYAENQAFIGMFTDEARIVMGLSHGNIAQVFDFGSIDGDYFLAMELVDGPPLSKVIKRAKALGMPVLPPEFAAFICAEMLKGLSYAHARLDEAGRPLKIVHRDVSPQNVLISFEGQVKLVDFGIAKARNAGTGETAAESMKGKYAYFAPEQAKGKELDGRADIFAAGVVLYELLSGQLPFPGRAMDAMARLVCGQFQRPRELNPRIPPELERVVLKAMALERGERYPTAEAFQQDLNRFLANNHPEFTGAALSLLLHLLFEEELAAGGRHTQPPKEFVERAQKWKQPLPPPASPGKRDESEEPTELVALSDMKLTPGPPRPAEVPRRPASRFPWGGALLLLLGAGVVGFGAVTLVPRLKEATLEITSIPSGARVILDGTTMLQPTPTQVSQLEGPKRLRLEVLLPGYRPWKNEVPINRGQHLLVEARLEVLPEPPNEPETRAVPLPVPVPVPNVVMWPVAKFGLDAARHRLDLSAGGATMVSLQPKSTYRVSLLGGAPAPHWGLYVVSDGGAQPEAFGAEPLLIKHASKLFAFYVPGVGLGPDAKREARPRHISILMEGQKRAERLSIPSELTFSEEQRVTVMGLSSDSAYELTWHQGVPSASVRKQGSPLDRLLLGTPSGLIIAPIDRPTRIEGVSRFWAALLDDEADGEAGRLELELAEVAPSPKKRD